ncbi:AI-2E family transporter [Ramlibacter monticola]|uniref:AI-2E family transporter n=1 Tax=Ramlibacter monticola TaxID=1926872 RepID=A0A936YWP2_9BURK|nr:AI-2E family transporter [Ramlibacter monticola]MBL0389591.1 AI-2E family transporter [Ramlibacter monticola]
MDLQTFRERLPTGWLLPACCFIALVHFGQQVLEPLTLALILSLVIAPLVRQLRRLGLPRRAATIASVALVGGAVLALASVLAFQLAAVAADLPQYRARMLAKVEQVRELTVGPLEKWRGELGLAAPEPRSTAPAGAAADERAPPAQAVPRLLGAIGRAMAECGVVLVLLVFMLLDQDALRDRLLRLAGRTELASTLQAVADAASGISRFFLTQMVVNLSLGVVVAVALWVIGLPHAALFGALVALLRILPYVGILAAGVAIAVFAAAVDPGWSLVLQAVGVLLVAELAVANVIEPNVYGHSSGLAPVAIIVAALFWSTLWGPVGLILSTPLTLCLVVAGRYVRALQPITIFFGDSPGITQGQRLYHRALAGELRDVQEDACAWLARRGFASYCDHVLLPATALAAADHRQGRLHESQLQALRKTLVGLVEWLTGGRAVRRSGRKARTASLVEANVGGHLRRMREARLGRWQGPLHASASAIVLCASLPLERDEFEAELLVRALADTGIDARSVTLPHEPEREETESGLAERISTVFVACPEQGALTPWLSACRELRRRLPRAVLATVRLPLDADSPDESALQGEVDLVLRSFAEALAFVQAGGRPPAPALATPSLPIQTT